MPSHVFLHYMASSFQHPKCLWLNHLPKKMNESITHSEDPLPSGWGVHIIEGPHRRAFFWATLAILGASVLVSTLWAVLKNDVQGGFGVGAWMVSVPSALMMASFFRWSGD